MTKKRKARWAWVGFARGLLGVVLTIDLLVAGWGALSLVLAGEVYGLAVAAGAVTGASFVAALLGILELLEAIARQTRPTPPS